MRLFIVLFCVGNWLLSIPHVQAQLLLSQQSNPDSLAALLAGPGVIIRNVQINCPDSSLGSFQLEMEGRTSKGLLLSNGNIADAMGANAFGFTGRDNGARGDTYLSSLVGTDTYNTCEIAFDILSANPIIYFPYTFASEEYPNLPLSNQGFQCKGDFNDVFAFLISGPGITGEQNLALIPGTSQIVTTNQINGDPTCNGDRSLYFMDNTGGQAMEFNGFTQGLFAEVQVKPCTWYRMKLKIADSGDPFLDTGVFVEALSANQIDLEVLFPNGGDALVESCNSGEVLVTRRGDLSQAETFFLAKEGTATEGLDYSKLPDTITFNPGEQELRFPFDARDEGLDDPGEFLRINLVHTCQDILLQSLEIPIYQANEYQALGELGDTLEVCNGLGQLQAAPGDNYTWSGPAGEVFPPNSASLDLANRTDGFYYIRMRLGSCTLEDSIYVQHNFLTLQDTLITECATDSVALQASGMAHYQWEPAQGLSCTDCPNPKAVLPDSQQVYTLHSFNTDRTCEIEKQIQIINPNGERFAYLGPTKVCIDASPKELSAQPAGGFFEFRGQVIQYFDPHKLSIGLYTIEYIMDNPNCQARWPITIEVTVQEPIDWSRIPPEICYNNPEIPLKAFPAGGIFTLTGDTISDLNPSLYAPGDYYLYYVHPGDSVVCATKDSLSIKILDQSPLRFPDLNDVYCQDYGLISFKPLPPGGDLYLNSQILSLPYQISSEELSPGDYELRYRLGCDILVRTFTVSANPTPLSLSPELLQVCPRDFQRIELDAGPGKLYFWSSDLWAEEQTTRKVKLHQTGVYELRVINEAGCQTRSSFEITEFCAPRLFAPDAFTPNGDGLNDQFEVFGPSCHFYELNIYNRNGLRVFQTKEKGQFWDGTWLGKSQPQGVYFLKVRYQFEPDSKLQKLEQRLQLIR